MPITEACKAIPGANAGTFYGWLLGQGAPNIILIDQALDIVGYHIEVEAIPRWTRPAARVVQKPQPITRSADLHPLMVEVYELFSTSGETITVISAEIGIGRGVLTRWFHSQGVPTVGAISNVLAAIGYRMKVVRGVRRRPSVRPES